MTAPLMITRNDNFSDIQSSLRDPKIEPFKANSPYKLIQNTKNTKIALKSRKIDIFQ